LTIHADTQKSNWVFVDATVFAVCAGLSEDVWGRTVSGFLDYSMGGAGRIESATFASSPSRSFLKVDLTPTLPSSSKGVLVRKVLLSDFGNGCQSAIGDVCQNRWRGDHFGRERASQF
jgi:hypothetical protein